MNHRNKSVSTTPLGGKKRAEPRRNRFLDSPEKRAELIKLLEQEKIKKYPQPSPIEDALLETIIAHGQAGGSVSNSDFDWIEEPSGTRLFDFNPHKKKSNMLEISEKWKTRLYAVSATILVTLAAILAYRDYKKPKSQESDDDSDE